LGISVSDPNSLRLVGQMTKALEVGYN
jgi:hypothetical protein